MSVIETDRKKAGQRWLGIFSEISCPPLPLVIVIAQIMLSACTTEAVIDLDTDDGIDVGSLPLIDIDNLTYAGGFKLPSDDFGDSSLNYAAPIIEKSGDSLFIVGNVNDDAIAEFRVPDLVNSTDLNDLNSTGEPVQNFSPVLNRVVGGNNESIDQINGLQVFSGQLIVNGIEYYDASADNSSTTLVVSDRADIASSTVKGFHRLPAAARAAGWMSELPAEWAAILDSTHIVGSSSGDPIIGRLSVGPSAYAVDAGKIIEAPDTGSALTSLKLLEFDLDNPLDKDLFNDSLQNDLWTHTSKALFGVVIPGTRTYATFGYMTGGEYGVGYKIVRDDGTLCAGYCSRKIDDAYNYYWFWDMNDLLSVKEGASASHSVRPYAYGKFAVPFQIPGGFNAIAGGSYDVDSDTLFLSIDRADNSLGPYQNPPVVIAYTFSRF